MALLVVGLALRLALAYVVFPRAGLWSDIRLFSDWTLTMADYGPVGFYANVEFSDYPPGFLYVLWMLGIAAKLMADLTGGAAAQLIPEMIKLPAILADICVAVVLYRALGRWQDERAGLIGASAYLFTPVTWYDSAMWGQVDAFGVLALALAAIWLIDRRPELASVAAVVAFLIKPQFAIALPVVAIVLVRRHLARRRSAAPASSDAPSRPEAALEARFGQGPVRFMTSGVAGVLALLIVVAPFDLESRAPPAVAGVPILGDVAGLVTLLGTTASSYNVLTANAFNPWALVGPTPLATAIGGDYFWTFDTLQILGVSAFAIGAAVFAVIAFAVALLLWQRQDRLSILLALAVLAVAFFVVPTRVHERYLFGAIGIGALLVPESRRWLAWFVAASAVGLVNLHAVLSLPFRGYGTPEMRALPFADLSRDPVVVSITALVSIVLLAWPLALLLRTWWHGRHRQPSHAEPELQPERDAQVLDPDGREPRAAAAETDSESRAGEAASIEASAVADVEPSPGPTTADSLDDRRPADHFRRFDAFVLGILIVAAVLIRLPNLERPLGLYFDETLHVTTATEFLQGWRYGIRQGTSEWTHPHLAKYAMAVSIEVFGGHQVRDVKAHGGAPRDAVVEPGRSTGDGVLRLVPSRLHIAGDEGVVVAEVSDPLHRVVIDGTAPSTVVTLDDERRRVWTGSASGQISYFDSAFVDTREPAASVPASEAARLDGPVAGLWSIGAGRLLASDGAGLYLFIDGELRARAPLVDAVDAVGLPGDVARIGVVASTGLHVLDGASLREVESFAIEGGPTGMAVVEGDPFERRARGTLGAPRLLVAAGSRIDAFDVMPESLQQADHTSMPGAVIDLRWNSATNLVHVLGSEGGRPTAFVLEPRSMSVFADAELPITPVAWGLDVRRDDPAMDEQRAVFVDGRGFAATVSVGTTSFAARLPGVALGVATLGLVYVLARLLLRRTGVALMAGGLALVEGLLFAQSRIATPDVYAGFFALAAFVLLAVIVRPSAGLLAPHRSRTLLLGFLVLGLLLGLGAASKWTALPALGAILVFLMMATPGVSRWVGVGAAGLAALALAALALSRPDSQIYFPLIAATGVVALALIARRWNRTASAWASPITPRQLAWGVPAILLTALATYVLSYVPYLFLDASGPQLLAGWPPSHDGETLLALHERMLAFHGQLQQPHGSGSPWWSWPLMLKPLWGYLESFAASQASVLMAPNPAILWLAVPALALAILRLLRGLSVSPVLLFIVLAFVVQWLTWAAVGRVTFMYHYYAALPFALLALTWLLSRLWHGPGERMWRWARMGAVVALAIAPMLWLLTQPLCAAINSDPQSQICTGSWSLKLSLGAIMAVAGVMALLAIVAWVAALAVTRSGTQLTRREQAASVALAISGMLMFAAAIGVPGLWRPSLELASPLVIGLILAVALLLPLALVLRSRSPRALVMGVGAAAGALFVILYPTLAAVPIPDGLALAYQALLPTWETSFIFPAGGGSLLAAIGLIFLPLAVVAAVAWYGITVLDRRRSARRTVGVTHESPSAAENPA